MSHTFRLLPVLLAALAVSSCRPAAPTPAPPPSPVPVLRYVPAGSEADPGRFEVVGLPDEALTDPAARQAALTVATAAGPGVLGTHGVDGGVLCFRPRFPLAYELTVTATFDPARLGLSGPVETVHYRRPRPPTPPAEVVAVYPSGDTIPENVLRFYLHFSQPMRRGEAYHRVRVLDPKGDAVDLPFLELDEELWDDAGTRLTLLIDPGRIKRGVKPREDIGPVFEAGKRYTLEIDAGWPDASGRPLKAGLRKGYTVNGPSNRRIEPGAWHLFPPKTADGPLEVRFREPLDRALLDRALTVTDPAGTPVAGRVEVFDADTSWRFIPARPWATGRHTLHIDPVLEDPAGNRADRLFDTPGTAAGLPTPILILPFQVTSVR